MRNIDKTLKVLSKLNSSSAFNWSNFEKFINSPYFNKSQELLQMIRLIKKRIRSINNFAELELSKEKSYSNIFKNARERQRCEKNLWQLLNKFVFLELPESEIYSDIALSHFYFINDLQECFNKHFENQQKLNAEKSLYTELDYWCEYNMFRYKYFFEIQNDPDRRRLIDNIALSNTLKNHELYHLINSLKLQCFFINDHNIIRTEIDNQNIEKLLKKTKKSVLFENYLVQSYYYCLKILKKTTAEKSYKKLRRLLEKHKFEAFDEQILLECAVNFCNLIINKGENDKYLKYLNESHKLNLIAINSTIFHTNGYLDTQRVKNIVTVGLLLNKVDWVEGFIQKYQKAFIPEHKANLYNFLMSQLSFIKKNYIEALDFLKKSNLKNNFFVISKSKLEIKILYEQLQLDQCNLDIFENAIGKFKVRISRLKKENTIPIDSYKNFTNIINQIQNTIDRDKLIKIRTKIVNTKLLAERKWLLEKVEAKLK